MAFAERGRKIGAMRIALLLLLVCGAVSCGVCFGGIKDGVPVEGEGSQCPDMPRPDGGTDAGTDATGG